MQPDIREYLAAERTLLSYARTAIGTMGFGFLVARLGIEPGVPGSGVSIWLGTAIIVFSVALNLIAIFEYRSLIRRLNEANQVDWTPSRLAPATAILLAVMGIVLAGYLTWPG